MANYMLNESKGRLAEVIDDGADLIIIPMSAVVAQATNVDGVRQLDTFLGVVGNTEQTGSTWARKVHANGAITVTIDDANDWVQVELNADDTWTGVAASNDTVSLLVAIDGASDAARFVVGVWDFAVTTDGNDVTADYNQTLGIWKST